MDDIPEGPQPLVDAVVTGLDLVRGGWRAGYVDRRASGDVLAVLVRFIDPSGAVTEQDLRTAAAAGIELLLDPGEIRAEVTFVFLDVLSCGLSPVMCAVLAAAADVEPHGASRRRTATGAWRPVCDSKTSVAFRSASEL